jgi:hypothetical protein
MEEIKQEVAELKEIVLNQNKIIKSLEKLVTTMAKAMYLIPVSEKDVIKIQEARRKNEESIHEAHHIVEQNMSTDDTASLFRDPIYTDSEIYGDVIADDFLGGLYETK